MDKPNSAELRLRLRPAHKAYLSTVAERVAFAGPLMLDDGQTMLGSLLVTDFPDRDAAHAWLAQEPFTQAGLYGSVAVHAFLNLWPQKVGLSPGVLKGQPMIKHIVMWHVRGATEAEKATSIAQLKSSFESPRGQVPGLLHLELGIDNSRID